MGVEKGPLYNSLAAILKSLDFILSTMGSPWSISSRRLTDLNYTFKSYIPVCTTVLPVRSQLRDLLLFEASSHSLSQTIQQPTCYHLPLPAIDFHLINSLVEAQCQIACLSLHSTIKPLRAGIVFFVPLSVGPNVTLKTLGCVSTQNE